MTRIIERKYAMTKVAAGDYLLPSNDGKTIWRLIRYMDGPSTGIMDWPRDRWVWSAWKWCGDAARVDLDAWDDWEQIECVLQSRAEAIDVALSGG